ncbi:hypothetical protein AK812_SmicGene38708 [Symbiodinium microadriaticum]|uniref:Uncharacterized protein n=1 Tax=Symbiodinium microadriaticum TaxID=2951 RepID=A0A1Q9CD28_SYMMI|nr:hypothetical protein AK812_SmicGene38708 [Symbiodinium microadriaticum]
MSMLAQRAQKVLDDQEAQSQAEDLDLYDPNHGFKYQKWDNKEGTMKAIPGRDPLPAKRIVEIAKEMSVLSTHPQLLNRFHATRQLQEQMEGATVTWLLEVGWRGEATARFWELLQLLSHNSALQMLGCTLRPDRLQRSALAQQLQSLLNSLNIQLPSTGQGADKKLSEAGTKSATDPPVVTAALAPGLWQSYDDSRHLRDEGGTEVVALQLSRFSNARGIATKLHHRIKAEPDILLPQWTSTGIL